jgi:membrane-bound lytic murein transglycosylase F
MKIIWDSKRNWTIIVLLLVIGLLLYANKKTSNGIIEDPLKRMVEFDLDAIKERGTLKAITGNNSLSYFVYRGTTMGYDYELLKEFADHLGVELEIVMAKNGNEFKLLNEGKGDILANHLIITKDRKQAVNFTEYYNQVQQVLIQRKPQNWEKYKRKQYEKLIIRSPIDLIGKEVYVIKNSASAMRLANLSDEIGGEIIIKEISNISADVLIQKVANGEINYAVAENDMALMNATYLNNIDIETQISFPQRVAWGVRKNAPELLSAVNEWILSIKKDGRHTFLYNKYFVNSKDFKVKVVTENIRVTGGLISPWDELIKEQAKKIGCDWRLIAALIFKESRFQPDAVSWAGAKGLMQLMPGTAQRFGDASKVLDPVENISMGGRYLRTLFKYWETIPDSTQRVRFVLASYNVGEGHILDAQRLAKKYGKDRNVWDNSVDSFLILKADPLYYQDEVVRNGYCRGSEPYRFVNEILKIYERYVEQVPDANAIIKETKLEPKENAKSASK